MSAFQPSSAATSDRLVNKVAMCGALFAGVAYVGYRIVKNAVKKNKSFALSSLGWLDCQHVLIFHILLDISACQSSKFSK